MVTSYAHQNAESGKFFVSIWTEGQDMSMTALITRAEVESLKFSLEIALIVADTAMEAQNEHA